MSKYTRASTPTVFVSQPTTPDLLEVVLNEETQIEQQLQKIKIAKLEEKRLQSKLKIVQSTKAKLLRLDEPESEIIQSPTVEKGEFDFD